jgi:hypothetical protein
MHPLSRQSYYGYTPTWFDWMTGYDWGTDACTRSGTEAFLCYKNYLLRVEQNIGWSPEVVQMLIQNAQELPRTSASQFWRGVQKNLFKWLRQNGYKPKMLPKFDKVWKVMQSFSDGAFFYDDLMEQKKDFFKDLADETAGDAWDKFKEFWQDLPTGAKIGIIAGGSLFVLVQVATIAETVGKLIPDKQEK